MKNGPFIDDLPIKNGDFLSHGKLLVITRRDEKLGRCHISQSWDDQQHRSWLKQL